MMERTAMYDVIIVGAGPAGATLGHELAKKGMDILILEKEQFPRYKPCAGGITPKTAELLDIDLSSVSQQEIHRARISYGFRREFVKEYHKPLSSMVRREEFDKLLVERAAKVGASVLFNQKVVSIQAGDSNIEVSTSNETYFGQIVVGADGANGVVSREMRLLEGMLYGAAVEAEVMVPKDTMARWDSSVGVDLGCIRGGYGWVFPKRDHLSIGLGAPVQRAKHFKTCHQEYLDALDLGDYHVERFKSHLLPVRQKGMPVFRDRVLLLGDAAGLVDPLSGEGIYHAIKSAYLATPVITRSIETRDIDLSDYQHSIERDIGPEMHTARRIQSLFTLLPHLSFGVLRSSDRLWSASCRLVRGDESYRDISKRHRMLRFVLG
ncbi:MAG: geranylgeranyl reductase family protein [Chloroflexota bacterium]|nr:geranylgeranyl reductase family protein [Chloroflexota bacterium]